MRSLSLPSDIELCFVDYTLPQNPKSINFIDTLHEVENINHIISEIEDDITEGSDADYILECLQEEAEECLDVLKSHDLLQKAMRYINKKNCKHADKRSIRGRDGMCNDLKCPLCLKKRLQSLDNLYQAQKERALHIICNTKATIRVCDENNVVTNVDNTTWVESNGMKFTVSVLGDLIFTTFPRNHQSTSDILLRAYYINCAFVFALEDMEAMLQEYENSVHDFESLKEQMISLLREWMSVILNIQTGTVDFSLQRKNLVLYVEKLMKCVAALSAHAEAPLVNAMQYNDDGE